MDLLRLLEQGGLPIDQHLHGLLHDPSPAHFLRHFHDGEPAFLRDFQDVQREGAHEALRLHKESGGPGSHVYTISTDRKVAVYGYEHKVSKRQVYTLWLSESIPTNSSEVKLQDFSVNNGNFEQPVLVDVITGNVYDIPAGQWSVKGTTYSFKGIPIYDAPVLLADKSLINIGK